MNRKNAWLLLSALALIVGTRSASAQSSSTQIAGLAGASAWNATAESSSPALTSWSFDEPSVRPKAEEPTDQPTSKSRREADDWQLTLSPYLWMTSLRAEVQAGPASSTTEECFSELLEQMDIGGQLRFEGHNGAWGFYLDGTYMKLSGDARARIGPFRVRGLGVDADFTQAWLDFGGMYRFGEEGRSLDVMLGGRYAYVGVDVSVGPFRTIDESEDFVSPVIGGRLRYALSDTWLLSLAGDVGGFGIGDAADLDWSITGLLGCQLSERTTLGLGYRFYSLDYSKGGLDLDLQFHGPVVGLSFQL
jgi:hypothetical protein